MIGRYIYIAQEGKVYFADKDITKMPLSKRAKMGITLGWQETVRFEGLTVKDYISVGMKEKKIV